MITEASHHLYFFNKIFCLWFKKKKSCHRRELMFLFSQWYQITNSDSLRYFNPQGFPSLSQEDSPMPAYICRLTAFTISKLEFFSPHPSYSESLFLLIVLWFPFLHLPIKAAYKAFLFFLAASIFC